MATNEAASSDQIAILEQVVVAGDLAKLNAHDRLIYYTKVCESVGLNPFTRPLEYITLNGRLVLYARKDATDQLRKINNVSVTRLEREVVEGLYVVTAYAKNDVGREDSEIGAVPIEGLKGESRANAIMKAVTKAKRRVTLSICGLGMLDETEVETLPMAQKVNVDPLTGALPDAPTADVEEMEDREVLLGRMKQIADLLGLKAPARASLLEKYGIRDPRTCDMSSLHDLLAELTLMRNRKADG